MYRIFKGIYRDKICLIASFIVLGVILISILAPYLTPQDPRQFDLINRLVPPSIDHVLGTDQLGRDILSRILVGIRTSLIISIGCVAVSSIIGTIAGAMAGLKGFPVDQIVMRLVDVQLSMPILIVAMILVVILGPGKKTVILALGLNAWMIFARMSYSQSLSLKNEGFVEASTAIGSSMLRIVFRDIIPNMATAILSLALIEMARYIIAEAALSFLGFGIQPPEISLGLMLSTGRDYLSVAWWVPTFPGLAIAIIALSFNLLSNRIREIIDPLQLE